MIHTIIIIYCTIYVPVTVLSDLFFFLRQLSSKVIIISSIFTNEKKIKLHRDEIFFLKVTQFLSLALPFLKSLLRPKLLIISKQPDRIPSSVQSERSRSRNCLRMHKEVTLPISEKEKCSRGKLYFMFYTFFIYLNATTSSCITSLKKFSTNAKLPLKFIPFCSSQLC